MKLVELSFPDEATAETKLELHRLCERLEKTAVEVPDAAGFVVNKLLFPYLFDAVRLLERNNIDAQGIDTCMKLGAGHPMGPLALLDFVGLDVAAAIGESIGADVPRARSRADRRRQARPQGRRGLLQLRLTPASAEPRLGRLAGIPAARSQTTSASPIP